MIDDVLRGVQSIFLRLRGVVEGKFKKSHHRDGRKEAGLPGARPWHLRTACEEELAVARGDVLRELRWAECSRLAACEIGDAPADLLPAALSSSHPTLLFFHSSVCDVCKSLHQDIESAQERLLGRANIVRQGQANLEQRRKATRRQAGAWAFQGTQGPSLAPRINADHKFWAPEVLIYGVQTVPCLVLLDRSKRALARSECPRQREVLLQSLGECR